MARETGMTQDVVTGCADFDVSEAELTGEFRPYAGETHRRSVIRYGRNPFGATIVGMLKRLASRRGQASFRQQEALREEYSGVDIGKLNARIILEGKLWSNQGQVVLINVEMPEEGATSETASRKVEKTPCVRTKAVLVGRNEVNQLQEEVARVFRMGAEESFEDGMISKFSTKIYSLVMNRGDAAILEISHLILNEKVTPELASEALRWLGRVDDSKTYSYRSWLLKKSLGGSSAYVRDGAALGIASMNDASAIPSLEKAIECEKCAELKRDLEEVLAQLKGGSGGVAS